MLLRAMLAEALRGWIERLKLTQAQAAKRFGISQPRISEITRGRVESLSLDVASTLTLVDASMYFTITFG